MPQPGEEHAPNPRNSFCVVAAEALLVVLPFLVMAIVLLEKGELSTLFYMPAWGIAGATLIGLSIVRFATGLLHGGEQLERLAWERVLLLFAAIVVFAFVPSLLVLALVLLAKVVSAYLAALQLLLFLIGLFLFIALGWAGEHVLSEADNRNTGRKFSLANSHAAD